MANEGKSAPLPLTDGAAEQYDNVPTKDQDGVPYCRKHHCRMHSRSAAGKTTGKDYYSCQVAGCSERGVRIRTVEKIVPPSPTACPRCTIGKTTVFCERDQRRSTAMGVVLVCPQCGWLSGMFAVPQLEALRLERRNSEVIGEIGDR